MSAPEQRCIGCQAVCAAGRCAACGVARVAGRWTTERILAASDHSRVYLARDGTGRAVALKELLLVQVPDVAHLESFRREAELLAGLSHPQIPRFVESFAEGEGPGTRLYLAQEFVEGQSPLEALSGRRMSEAEARALAQQVLPILAWLHEHVPPVYHRDLKPANLVRRPSGEIALVDFGAARTVARGATHRATLVGTFGYMPPEQLGGTVDQTSDLYGLGATLLHLLSGKPPETFLASDLALRFRGELEVSRQFGRWLQVMLEPRRERRFQSARQALGALSGRGARARLPAIVALALAAVIACGIALVVRRPPAAEAPHPKEAPREDQGPEAGASVEERFARSCSDGDAPGCCSLGFLYEKGQEVPQDFAKAAANYARGCQGGVGVCCSNLGGLYNRGQGVPRDPARAFVLWKQGCEKGSGRGCLNVGVTYATGDYAEKDLGKAFEAYSAACKLDDAEGCNNLGYAYYAGEGCQRDYVRARGLYEQSCKAGLPRGCGNLGFLHANGLGVPPDLAAGLALEKRACVIGDAASCSNAEEWSGKPLAAKVRAGAAGRERSCAAGQPDSCGYLGTLQWYGLGMPQDRAKAQERTQAACEGGDQSACHEADQRGESAAGE